MDFLGYPSHKCLALSKSRFFQLVRSFIKDHLKDEDSLARLRSVLEQRPDGTLLYERATLPFSFSTKEELLCLLDREENREYREDILETKPIDTKRDGTQRRKTFGLTLALWNIRSSFNVGSIIRTADALGVEKVIFCGYTQLGKGGLDTSRGSEEYLFIERFQDVEEVMNAYEKTHTILGIDRCEGSFNMAFTRFHAPILGILGNEKYGLSPDILKRCDKVMHIEMWGYKYSMNVAVAMGIATYEIRRQLTGHS